MSARLLRLPSGRPRHRGRRSRRRLGTRRRRVLPRRVRRLRCDWRERRRPSSSARLARTTPTVRLASPEPATAPITSAHPNGISGRPRARTSVIETCKRPRPADPAWPLTPVRLPDRIDAEPNPEGEAERRSGARHSGCTWRSAPSACSCEALLCLFPFADANCLCLPGEPGDEHEDDFVLLADAHPMGYHATELARVSPGDSVAIYG